MAKNREHEKPVESESESGEEDDEVSSEEVGSSDSDSEPEQTLATAPAPKKSQPQPASKPPYPSSSSEEEDEESGSEPESLTEPVDPNVKPLLYKPMEEQTKPTTSAAVRKPRSKTNASQPLKATGGAKRPAEEKEAEPMDNKSMDNKRSKKKPPTETESSGKTPSTPNYDSKKQLFQRLWSEEDEIVVLKGMIDYAAKKKSDPVADLSDFHDFIKKSLHVDVTRTQLQNKIRRLKQKYENNKSKEKKGKERTFSKAHEQKAYDLSKKIWGSENDNVIEEEKAVGSPKTNGTVVRKTASKGVNKVENSNSKEVKSLEVANANADVEMMAGSFSTGSFSAGNLGMSMRERILTAGAEFFEGENKVEGHKEWMKLRVEEIELEAKKYDLMRAQAKLVLNVLSSSDH